MRKGILISVLLLFFMSYFAPKSEAVSCAFGSMVEPWMEWDNRADAVIVATVTDMKQVGMRSEVTADVLESYKGIEVNQITFTEDASWGIWSQVGETYIYGLMLENNEWILPLCSYIPSSMDSYSGIYQELSLYPTIELIEPTFSNSNMTYIIAVTIIVVVLLVFILIFYMKRKTKRKHDH